MILLQIYKNIVKLLYRDGCPVPSSFPLFVFFPRSTKLLRHVMELPEEDKDSAEEEELNCPIWYV